MNVEFKIKETLSQLRVFVMQDGGDMEFVSFKNKIVYIRLLGNCIGCGLVDITFKDGIEKILIEEYPNDVEGVEVIM